jgi:hypothetical protein
MPRRTLERHDPQLETRRPSMGYQREKVARDLLGVEQAAAGTHAT